jgi:hypothetical protein
VLPLPSIKWLPETRMDSDVSAVAAAALTDTVVDCVVLPPAPEQVIE